MSHFQLGLLLIGALVILGVVVYNLWAVRRNAPLRGIPRGADESTGASHRDRVEPVLQGEVDAGPGAGDEISVQPDGTADTDPEEVQGHPVGPAVVRQPLLDPLIDALAPMALEQPVSGEAVLAALPRSRRVGTKPFAVEGLHADTQCWEAPRVGQRYSALQAGVQLANRAGALNEIEFSEFVMKAQALADALSAAPDFPDMMHEVARARELDQFASAHDAQLSFTLRAVRAAWSPGYLVQHAARMGLVAGALPGRMVLPASEQGQAPLLVLQFETQAALADDPEQSALRDCQLTLDVPHVARHEQAFERLRGMAFGLAQATEGVVTDDMGQALDPATMERIGVDLERLYDALDERGLAAGSALSRRLFS
jgi:hypothetical protein